MADGFRLELDHLRSSGSSIAEHGGRLAASVERLRGAVVGAGSPWGADEFGTVVAAAYTGITTLALDRYAALATRLDNVGQALRTVADNSEAADRDAADRAQARGEHRTPRTTGVGHRPTRLQLARGG